MSENATLLGQYLRAKRSGIQPEDIGVERDSTRRVSGLRREEVADLAGISTQYYLRLEQGQARQPSYQVLAALANALRLDRVERIHLHHLARLLRVPEDIDTPISPDVATIELVHRLADIGVVLVDNNFDVLSANEMSRLMMPGISTPEANFIIELCSVPFSDARERRRVLARSTSLLRFLGYAGGGRLDDVVRRLTRNDTELKAVWDRHDVSGPGSLTASVVVEPLGVVDLECQVLLHAVGRQAIFTISSTTAPRSQAAFAYLRRLDSIKMHTSSSEKTEPADSRGDRSLRVQGYDASPRRDVW